jgi:putative MATE family efflux protein
MKNVNLLEGPIDSSLRKFAFPLVLSFVIHNVYSWVDMYFVSRLGDNAIAAVGSTEQLLFLVFGVGIGFGIGSGIIVARRIGEKKYAAAAHTVSQSIVFGILLACIMGLIVYFGSGYVFDYFDLKGEVRSMAETYVQSISIGIVFNFTIFQVNSIIRSSGNTLFPMVILITANIFNAIISPVLIFGLGPIPAMGIFGAGLGTSAAQFLGMLFALYILIYKFGDLKPKWKGFKVDFGLVWQIIRLGVPASLQLLVVGVNRFFLIKMTTYFGVSVMTTYIIGLRVDMMVYMSIFALGASMEIITGQNLGARQVKRIFNYYFSSIKQLSVLIAVLTILVWIFGHQFASIFTDDKIILDQVKIYLKIISFSYLTFAIGIVSIRVISGAGAYFKSLFLVVLVIFIIQLPLSYGLSQYTGLEEEGIWYGILISQVIFAGIGYIAVVRKKWIRTKV